MEKSATFPLFGRGRVCGARIFGRAEMLRRCLGFGGKAARGGRMKRTARMAGKARRPSTLAMVKKAR